MDKYGLIGYPLGHSFSRNYFNEKFENEGIDAKYINFEIPHIEDLTEILDTTPERTQCHDPLQGKGYQLPRLHQPRGYSHRSCQCHQGGTQRK